MWLVLLWHENEVKITKVISANIHSQSHQRHSLSLCLKLYFTGSNQGTWIKIVMIAATHLECYIISCEYN